MNATGRTSTARAAELILMLRAIAAERRAAAQAAQGTPDVTRGGAS